MKLIFAILILLISKIDFEKINQKILNRLDNLISKIENKYLTQTKKCDTMYTQGRKTLKNKIKKGGHNMSLYPVKSVSFVNEEYKKEWAEWVPGYEGKVRYCEGNYALDPDGTKTVWDGAGILMGWILPDGTFKGPDIDPTVIREYNLTFLRSAAKN